MKNTKAINKDELYRQVSDDTNIALDSVRFVCDSLFDNITKNLQSCQPVRIRNFGIFGIKSLGERISRKPKTNEQIIAKAKNLPNFRYSEKMKELLNQALNEDKGDKLDGKEETK